MDRHPSDRIDQMFRGAAAATTRVGPDAWRLAIENGSMTTLDARVVCRWLELSAAVPEDIARRSDREWLEWNTRHGATIRAARALAQPAIALEADVWIDDNEHFDDDLRRVVEASCHAVHHITADPLDREPRFARASGDRCDEIERALAGTGVATTRIDGALRIDLPTRVGSFEAYVESAPAESDRLIVELSDLTAASAVSTSATARLLLALPSVVRLVAGVIGEPPAGCTAAVVAPVARWIAADVERAVSALAVACQMVAREIDALKNERLAAHYLAVTSPPTPPASLVLEEESVCHSPQ